MKGFNIAEATNFVSERWIPIGVKAKICKCSPSSVFFNVLELETHILREKKRRLSLEILSTPTNINTTMTKRLTEVEVLRCLCKEIDDDEDYDIENRVEFKRTDVYPHSKRYTVDSTGELIKKYSDAIDKGIIFQCDECDCWCHTICYNSTPHYHDSPPTKVSICYMCRNINRSLLTDGDFEQFDEMSSNSDATVDKSQHDCGIEYHDCFGSSTKRSLASTVIGKEGTSKFISLPPSKRQKGTVEKGDWVRACVPGRKKGDNSTTTVEGVVTDVVEGQFRLHRPVKFMQYTFCYRFFIRLMSKITASVTAE